MSNTLVPNYLDIDFNTIKQRIIDNLSETETFQDYNYEGANITILIELFAYLGELSTYYLNRIAKNEYIDTADLYENVHRLASLIGYYPYGHKSSTAMMTLTLSEDLVASSNLIKIEPWIEITSSEKTKDGREIVFATTKDVFLRDLTPPYQFQVVQGKVRTYTYTGTDLIDNKIILPFLNFSYDDDIDDELPVIELSVNGILWTRISDFYDELSGLYEEELVYMFNYNKYGQYIIEFSSMRSVPETNDTVVIKIIESLGLLGDVGANTIVSPEDELLSYVTDGSYVSVNDYSVTNELASNGGSDPETIEEIKENAKGFFHAQYRNVTKTDYTHYLQSRTDVIKATVWGEQEVAPSGYFPDYNKVYITLISNDWATLDNSTMTTILNNDGLYIPIAYNPVWLDTVSRFLEPRKMLCAYEEYVLPELIYFRISAGLILKRTYRYATVVEAVRNKLTYYFDSNNRSFGETISFTDIEDYIMDTSIVDGLETFEGVKGLHRFIIRNIDVYNTINEIWTEPYEYNSLLYPRYTVPLNSVETGSVNWDENLFRNIELGFNQFPALPDMNSSLISTQNKCSFAQET
jgi:hypothetical protein